MIFRPASITINMKADILAVLSGNRNMNQAKINRHSISQVEKPGHRWYSAIMLQIYSNKNGTQVVRNNTNSKYFFPIAGHPWYSSSALDCWSTGQVIDPAPGA